MQPDVPHIVDVPGPWRTAAEEVRAHLCTLRGGALFLSSNDALLLVQWLEAGVAVPDILRALERAADARSKNRGRFPLSLVRAKVHLGKPTRGVFHGTATPPVSPSDTPFGPVAHALRAVPRQTEALRALARALTEIDDPGEEGLRAAMGCVRTYQEAAWAELPEPERVELRAQALAALGDLADFLDEATLEALVDEESRTLFRQRIPCVSAASLWELVQSDGR